VIVIVIEHRPVRAKAHARQTPYTKIHLDTHIASSIPIERQRGARINTRPTLIAEDGAGKLFLLIIDANPGFLRVDFIEERIGTSLFANVTRNAKFGIVR
jgi:hypothetical protein